MHKVVFVGGKTVGCGCFQSLLKQPDVQVEKVFVNPSDMLEGRWYPSLAELALSNGISVSMEPLGHADLERIDFLFCIYYDRIIPRDMLRVPSINLHLGLAEEYRGCYPTTWALMNGEDTTGVTLHWIDEGIDTGDIIALERFKIGPGDTGGDLYHRLSVRGVSLFSSYLRSILEGRAEGRAQQSTVKTKRYSRKQFPSHEIPLTKEQKNHIRAVTFEPFPKPYVMIGDHKFEISEVPHE